MYLISTCTWLHVILEHPPCKISRSAEVSLALVALETLLRIKNKLQLDHIEIVSCALLCKQQPSSPRRWTPSSPPAWWCPAPASGAGSDRGNGVWDKKDVNWKSKQSCKLQEDFWWFDEKNCRNEELVASSNWGKYPWTEDNHSNIHWYICKFGQNWKRVILGKTSTIFL